MADIYVKVTLYEGTRVIKARKTRLLSCGEVGMLCNCVVADDAVVADVVVADVADVQSLEFNEKFSIRLPASYLDSVSCVVSLCSR